MRTSSLLRVGLLALTSVAWADEVIVVADSSKFDRSSLALLCPLGEIDVLVVDSEISNSWQHRLTDAGVKLLALMPPAGPGEPWNATLAVTEQQALSLIAAQSAGREIRLLPRP